MAVALISTLIPIAAGLIAWLVKAITGLQRDHAKLETKLDGMAEGIGELKGDMREMRETMNSMQSTLNAIMLRLPPSDIQPPSPSVRAEAAAEI